MSPTRPRIGLLGIMQALYDDMLPGVTDRQQRYAEQVAASLGAVCEVTVSPPVKSREDAEAAMRAFEADDLDGVLVVMLTYGPAMRVARAFAATDLPLCLANIQPDGAVTARWDMGDLTYNQGVHGAQDTANAMVRGGVPFAVITEDWQAPVFADRVGAWARGAAAARSWRRLRVAVFGYTMNDMGDTRFDETALLRRLGPEVSVIAPGALHRATEEVGQAAVDEVLAWEDERFSVDAALSLEERGDHARMQLGIEQLLAEGGYGAYSTHFGAIAEDGRFARLPLAAASTLMARGIGFAAEGDALHAALFTAGRALAGEANFTEMYAMDFPSDSILMSHMGEGNWAMAREDRPIRLIKRELGIGGLADPPTFLFQYRVGPATLATLVALGERFRLVVAEGEILDTPELPHLEMPYGHFRPDSGLRACLDGWLRHGGPHHQVLLDGRRAEDWRAFCAIAQIELVQV